MITSAVCVSLLGDDVFGEVANINIKSLKPLDLVERITSNRWALCRQSEAKLLDHMTTSSTDI